MPRLAAEGALLKYATLAAPSAFKIFAFVTELPTPAFTRGAEIDLTNLFDAARTVTLGALRCEPISVRFFYDPAAPDQYARVFEAMEEGEILHWRIEDALSNPANVFPAVHSFDAVVSGLSTTRAVNGMGMGQLTIQVLNPHTLRYVPEHLDVVVVPPPGQAAFTDGTAFSDNTAWTDS